MAAGFSAAGYTVVPFVAPADAVVIHGCAITHKAERDSLRLARQARRAASTPIVVVTGCTAEVLGDALRGTDTADLVVGQAGKFAIPALLHRIHPHRFPPPTTIAPADAGPPQFDTTRALVKVQDGCDFRCAYCIVPAARGAPVSRPLGEVVEEIRRLADAGFKEIVLTGANLGCYGNGPRSLVDLVGQAESVPGIERIRLSSIELTTAEQPIVDHMAQSSKLCHFLHVPLQSGDDRILAAMGRRYTAAQYRAAVEYAVAKVPDLGLGTDIIVGFPSEDDRAFASTVRTVEDLPFGNVHVFSYSRRPGTRAADLADPVPESIKKARTAALLALASRKRAEFAARFVGKPVSVLVERVDAAGIGHGWTGQYVEAEITAPALRPNQLVTFTVARVDGAKVVGTAAG